MRNSPKCLECQNLVCKDIGYSEYTITGEIFKCTQDCFKDWAYSDDNDSEMLKLKEIGETCEKFIQGSTTSHCIDCEIDESSGECTCGSL
jgi:hypothetical protein